MSINEKQQIDMIVVSDKNVELFIIDYREWEKDEKAVNEHMFLLQEKVNAYIACYESGELFDIKPEAKGKDIVFRIISRYCVNDTGSWFLSEMVKTLEQINIGLIFEWRVM